MISAWATTEEEMGCRSTFDRILADPRRQTVPILPTVFPDGTSQVWKLPEDFLGHEAYVIDWRFESERELFDVGNLVWLLREASPRPTIHLHIPYLPFARQDKEIGNSSTFSLLTFAGFLQSLEVNTISAVDAHNPERTTALLDQYFRNISVAPIQKALIDKLNPDILVFPDKGAGLRYLPELDALGTLKPLVVCCEKVRDPLTGSILEHSIPFDAMAPGSRILILDDICDGGATFISVAKALRRFEKDISIHLFITHGIFSRGRHHLKDNGIDHVYCTNSFSNGEFRV